MKTLYTINTGNNFMDIIYNPFAKPFLETHNDVEIYNIMDDSLLVQTRTHQGVSSNVLTCMYNYAIAAQQSGADGILVTCTSVNEATERIRPFLTIPMINIEEPVAEQALEVGGRIGILGTVPTSPDAMEKAILTKAAALGKKPQIIKAVAEGAYDELLRGDRNKHDEIVKEHLSRLEQEVDVIVFSQISMSLLKHAPLKVPCFKIGTSGFERILQLMNANS